jgi:hypothetical protein
MAASESERLQKAMNTVVSRSIKTTVEQEPRDFIQALEPVLLPAIKRSITTYFNELVQSLQRTLEHSLSVQSLRWRIEAMRTGRSFTEIALLRSLIYKVEQVLLIDHDSGLLLNHVGAMESSLSDPELISGMVTALNDFMRDSFRMGYSPLSGSLHYDEYTVWTERGHRMTVAAFIRGNPPSGLRETLRGVLSQLSQKYPTLEAAADHSQPILLPCLMSEYRPKPPQGKPHVWRRVAIGLLLLPVLIALVIGVLAYQKSLSLEKYERTLKAVPGIVILESRIDDGKFRLEGLRDTHSLDPALALSQAGLDPAAASLDLKPFFSTESAAIVHRVKATLEAPDTVRVESGADRIKLSGFAPYAWVQSTRRKLKALQDWLTVDTTALADNEGKRIRELSEKVEGGILIEFPRGSSRVDNTAERS